jgi:hypothetical protein
MQVLGQAHFSGMITSQAEHSLKAHFVGQKKEHPPDGGWEYTPSNFAFRVTFIQPISFTMENRTEFSREVLDAFLDRWSFEKLKSMTLEGYVSIGNQDTFTQWVETKTLALGNIKGPVGSIKFGIYERIDKNKEPKNYNNDSMYSWRKALHVNSSKKAFDLVRKDILQIVDYATSGKFEQIDNLILDDIFKWKVAFLYSNERLIPIFKRDVLLKIARAYGVQITRSFKYSEIQQAMISRKPAHISVYDYMMELWNKFGGKKKKLNTKKTSRRAVTKRNISPQMRHGASNYVATQKHNILQLVLWKKLIAKYGKRNVTMEENYVDIKVTQPLEIRLYEVKSSSHATDCMKEALGQILAYTHGYKDPRPKKLIVAGQYEPNANDLDFINYVKKTLNLSIEYESIGEVITVL